jgi:hypothetical protein
MGAKYRIKTKGILDRKWSDWFDGFDITCCSEETVLTGHVVDQAELHGILDKLHDLRLPILLVEQLPPKSEPPGLPEK